MGSLVSVESHLKASIAAKTALLSDRGFLEQTVKLIDECINAYRNDRKILIAGNGGSAADAQHFAGELISRFKFDRPPLNALALTTDTSIITAIGNDYGYDEVFSRQVTAIGRAGDIFIAISTSGNSKNIIKAIAAARNREMLVVGLTGRTGGAMGKLCDICLQVPSLETPTIQECHLAIEHIICAEIEEALFANLRPGK